MTGSLPPAPPSLRPKQWRVVLTVVGACLVGAESIARLIEPQIPPELWPSLQTEAKADQMTALASTGQDIDVVFLGSSSMDQAINPVAFNMSSSGLTGYNASLNGASVQSLEPWAVEVVLPMLDPQVVVIGLTSRELNDRGLGQRQFYNRVLQSDKLAVQDPGGIVGFFDAVEDSLALLRLRPAIGQPWASLRKLTGEDVQVPLGPFGQKPPEERDFRYDVSEQWIDEWIRRDMSEFVMGGGELAALRRLVETVRDQDRMVILAELPVSQDYGRLHPGGPVVVEEFSSLLADTAGIRGVRLADLPRQFDVDDFRDPSHLNPDAAEILSAYLAEHLDDLAAQGAISTSANRG